MLQKIFARKVKAAREQLGLSQYDLADKLDVRSLTVSKWERALTWPQPEVVDALAELSGKPAYWFFLSDEDKDSPLRSLQGSAFYSVPTDIFVSECVNF